jgi:hypothetical protein
MSTQDADTPGVPEPPAKVVAVADQIASAVDHAVPVSDEPANRVLVDNARLVRWAAPAFVICSLMLLPWIAVLGTTLPQRQLSQHYRLAWTGYDVLLALGLAALRSRRYAAPDCCRSLAPRPVRCSSPTPGSTCSPHQAAGISPKQWRCLFWRSCRWPSSASGSPCTAKTSPSSDYSCC